MTKEEIDIEIELIVKAAELLFDQLNLHDIIKTREELKEKILFRSHIAMAGDMNRIHISYMGTPGMMHAPAIPLELKRITYDEDLYYIKTNKKSRKIGANDSHQHILDHQRKSNKRK